MKKTSNNTFDPSKLPFFKVGKFPVESNVKLFNYIVEVAADEVFIMESDSQIIYVNQSACDRLGYRRDELLGMYVWEWDPLFPKAAWPGFWKELVEKKHLHFETKHKTKSGEIFPVEIHGHYYEYENKELILAFANDLTEKKKLEEENLFYHKKQKEYAESALLERTKELEEAQRLGKIGSWQLKIKEKTFTWSPEVFRIFEIDDDQFIDSYDFFLTCIHPEDRKRVAEAYKASLKNKTPYSITHRLLLPDGSVKWIEESCETLYDSNDQPVLSRGTVLDITKKIETAQALENEKKRLENIIWGTQVGTWEWNIETGETVFNELWAAIIGYTLEELAPISIDTWLKHSHPDDLKHSEEELNRVFSGEKDFYQCEVRMQHKSGKWVWVLDRGKVVQWKKDGSPLLMAGTHTDISDKKKYELELESANQQLFHLAQIDGLTQIPNRRAFESYMDREWKRLMRSGEEVSVLMIDIDYFKQFNDQYGHPSGDSCLKKVAEILAQSIGRPSDFVARYGGEEFICLLPETSLNGALFVAESIQTRLRKMALTHGASPISPYVTLSIGAASARPGDYKGPDTLISDADQCLYIAKKNGRNRVLSKHQ